MTMFCHNCGTKIEENTKFCQHCGKSTSTASGNGITNIYQNAVAQVSSRASQTIIKCGNCAYEGQGESARRIFPEILAWLCVLFAPLITILYFVATPKYRCPKCKSTFLGVKNKQGVFTGQTGNVRPIVILVCVVVIIAIIGILSTLAAVSLGSARVKARDAKRLADLRSIQTALEIYYTDQDSYPSGSDVILGSGDGACLNAKGWQPSGCLNPYMSIVPADPSSGMNVYVYSSFPKSYMVTAALEGENGSLSQGLIKLTPDGITK